MPNLEKGQNINLEKVAPGLNKVVVGLGWDTKRFDGGDDFDLDVSVFMQDEAGITKEENFIYYNNKQSENGSVIHTGDNLTGAGDGDDEQIKIDLSAVPKEIKKMVFAITIHKAKEREQKFGYVENAYVRVIDEQNNKELVRYDLNEDYDLEISVVVAELYKHNDQWKFKAIGNGFQGDLGALCEVYKVV